MPQARSETLRTLKRYSLHLYLGPTIPLGLWPSDDGGADEDDMIARRLLVLYRTLLALCSGEKRKDQIAEALDPLNRSASTPPGTICIKIL